MRRRVLVLTNSNFSNSNLFIHDPITIFTPVRVYLDIF